MKTESQLNLFDIPAPSSAPASVQSAANGPDSFGCCSSYRACSDAGECIISDRDYSVNCLYRKNLESGRIFYGKNANSFDPEKYAGFRRCIDALSAEARAAFDAILIDFSEYHRSAHYCIVRNKYIPELSAVGLFEFRAMGAEFPKLCSHRSFLKPAVMSHPEYGPLFQKAQAERRAVKKHGFPKAGTKDFLLHWLNHDGIPLRDMLAEPYRFVYLPSDHILYAEELYQDTLFSGCGERIYPQSPFAEDGLLSPAVFEEEESRRLKVSRGYSQAEKERLLAGVHDISSVYANGNLDRYNPLWGKMCVVTGVLSRMDRSEAFSEISRRGGRTSDTPVNSMDILILGYQEWSAMNGGVASRKVQKAVDLQKSGKNVKIISEDEFYSMLEKIPV